MRLNKIRAKSHNINEPVKATATAQVSPKPAKVETQANDDDDIPVSSDDESSENMDEVSSDGDDNDDYELGHMLSKNEISTVYRALNYNNAKLIIVKSYDFDTITNVEYIERVAYVDDNINKIKMIKNYNIIKYIKTSQNTNQSKVEVSMEYVPGGSLKAILTYFCSFKENLVKIYTQQILNALKSLHFNKIVHGDVKLDNIMVDDLGTLKLSDFAFLKRSLISTSKFKIYKEIIKHRFENNNKNYKTVGIPMIGSELNCPPEVLQDEDYELQPSYDIWCLGLVIYEMLTGSHLFSFLGDDKENIIERISEIEDDIDISLPVSANCKNFLQSCLKADPTQRETADSLREHPFLVMSKVESRDSRRASGMMSFFSIVASQTSMNNGGGGSTSE